MAKPRMYSVAAGAVAVIVALSMLLASVRGPVVVATPPEQNAAARPVVPDGRHDAIPAPTRKPGVRATAPKRLQPPDMPAGPGLPEWSRPISD